MRPAAYYLRGTNPAADAEVRANCHAFIERLAQDRSWRIEVHQHKDARTPRQRRTLFGVAYKAIMEHMGLQGSREKNQLHFFMCGEFFGWKEDAIGRRVPVRTTTTNERGEHEEIDKDTANEFFAFIQRKAAECGIDVPDPDPEMRSQ